MSPAGAPCTGASASPSGGKGPTGPCVCCRVMATDPNCLFCKIVSGELPATRIAEDERTVAFMDVQPATRGHALVVPRAHATDVWTADPEDVAASARTAQRIALLARDRLGAAGVNLLQSSGAAAWQTVFHLHVHVIPRYEGDPLRLPWVPAPADPEDIRTAGDELRA